MNSTRRRQQADKILYDIGLWNYLREIGEPHIIGSYKMDMMAWNDLDLWFFDRETIDKAESYCDRVLNMVRQQTGSRERIMKIKQELLERGLYGFYQYSSMDVYRAVLEQGISDVEDLLKRYIKKENKI